jgi:methylamine dehydrogenase light chain
MADRAARADGPVAAARPARACARTARLLAAALGLGLPALLLAPATPAGAQAWTPSPGEPDVETPAGDPTDRGYWRYCAIDGFLASCCGGTPVSCPPGTEMSPITWIGTCRNPADGKDYVISYNDCCGKSMCGRCFTSRNEGDKPVYFTPKSNDINWCMGSKSTIYNSTVAIILGVAGGP